MTKRLITQIVDKLGKSHEREHGDGTNKAYHSASVKIAEFLLERYGLQNIDNMKPHMVEAYFEQRLTEVSDRSCAREATVMRDIAESIGKRNIVPKHNSDLGIKDTRNARYQPKSANKEALAVVRANLVERAGRSGTLRDQALIVAFDARAELGVRAKESFMSRVVTENGRTFVESEAGSKGGRWRSIPCDTPAKMAVAIEINRIAGEMGNKNGYMIPKNITSKQMYDYNRYCHAKAGGTVANNANMHVTRHAFVRSELASGKTDIEVSRLVGHGREEVLDHYRHQ